MAAVPVVLLSFLCIDPNESIRYLGADVPDRRGVWRNPLRQLLNALGTYWQYVYDHSSKAGDDGLRAEFSRVLGEFGRDSKDARTDFVNGDLWAKLRELASLILADARIDPVPLPCPLPFEAWIDLKI